MFFMIKNVTSLLINYYYAELCYIANTLIIENNYLFYSNRIIVKANSCNENPIMKIPDIYCFSRSGKVL